MKKILQLALSLMLCLTLLCGCASAADPAKTTGVGFYFDTVVTVTLYGAPDGLMEEIWACCDRYEKLLSKTVAESDVSRINAAGGQSVTVDPETWEILRRAKEISAMTGGAFSVTIAPLSAMWDFTGGTNRMPTDEERIAALPLVDDSRIQLGENNTVTLPAGMQIDLGGIAKGHIADAVAAHVRDRAFGAILSFGGNVYVVGDKPDGSLNSIGIQDPDAYAGTPLAVLYAKNTSVVTSGTYERGFTLNGVRYHHILDPDTGLPATSDLVSATLVMDSSMTADALATACIVMGSEASLAMLREAGLDALLITAAGEMLLTDGFADKYPLRTLQQ